MRLCLLLAPLVACVSPPPPAPVTMCAPDAAIPRSVEQLAVYRAENQGFAFRNLAMASFHASQVRMGLAFKLPFAGDFDGDGISTVGLYDPSTGKASLLDANSSTASVEVRTGPVNARPVVGDWDGDGRDSLGWFLPATATFELGEAGSFVFGAQGGWPVAGDFDGDGRDGVGVWSPELGVVQLRESTSTLRFGSLWSGLSFPVAGDFDGSGRDEVRLFVASTNTLYRLEADAPVAVEAFGPRGYLLPLAGRFTAPTTEPHGFAWPTGTPASQGVDAGALEVVLGTAAQVENLHTVLVVRRGVLVREAVLHHVTDEPNNVQSISKSVTSLLAGIAVQQGLLDVEQTVAHYLPDAMPNDGEPRRARIKVKHLLTMTSGLVMPDDATWVAAHHSPDVVKAVLAARMDSEPGTAFAYSTGVSHVMGAILERVTGSPLDAFARKHLFEPMGVQLVGWGTDRNGVTQGGSSLVLRPRDLARLGELMLRGGKLGDRQLVPSTWVTASTSVQTHAYGAVDYGAYWWLTTRNGRRVFEARGHGGQVILVVPELELVVVVTSNPFVGDEVGNSMVTTALGLAEAVAGTVN